MMMPAHSNRSAIALAPLADRNRGSGWYGCPLALLLLSAACADSTLTAKDAGSTDMHEPHASDAGKPDSGRRVKERTVAIDVVQVATREVRVGADGTPEYGEMQPLDGADVCAVQRRDAYADFEPFEPIVHPPCVKSVANDVAHLEGIPANSDVIVTIEYEGLQPLAVHYRTGDFDIGGPGWETVKGEDGRRAFALVLVKPGAFDRWLEPAPGPDEGVAAIQAVTWWSGSGPARAEALKAQDQLTGHAEGFGPGQVKLVVDPAGDAAARTTTTPPSGIFLSLPAGSARVKFINDDRGLPVSLIAGASGLKTAELDTVELPILAGHDHLFGFVFSCWPGPGDGELLDLQACTFAPADADAGQP